MKKALPFVIVAACVPLLSSDGFDFIQPAEAQSTAMPSQMGFVTTSCANRSSPCFEQYGPVIPIAGSFSASVTVTFPTIGDPVPATGIYSAAEGSTGDLEGLLLDASRNLNVNCVVGCAGGTFTNGTDNVAASADNGKTAAWVYLWDGSAYDMWRGTAADGALVNLGTNNDVTVTGTVSGTGTAGSAASGVLTVQGIASMTPVQVSQATAGNLNATVVGTGTFAVQAAQSGTWNVGTVTSLTGGNITASQGGAWTVQPGNTQNTTPWLTAPSASSGVVGSTRCAVLAYANTENETNCKNAAGVVYGFTAYNTTTAALYLTFYNAHTGAVCGTSEVETHVIPGNSAGAGAVVNFPVPVAFSTGISYCITTAIDGTGATATASGSATVYTN